MALELDLIADQIEDLGVSAHGAAFSFARLIMQHLLPATHSPAAELQRLHWLDEADESRSRIEERLTPPGLDPVYSRARRHAARRMRRYGEHGARGRAARRVPCTLNQILGPA